jgi:metal-responsive CopG/Arc/MetJ family transcriptional regulator
MNRTSIFLTEDQQKALEKLATERVNVSEHIRRAIDEYLRKQRARNTNPGEPSSTERCLN